jgi:hypothetical protein
MSPSAILFKQILSIMLQVIEFRIRVKSLRVVRVEGEGVPDLEEDGVRRDAHDVAVVDEDFYELLVAVGLNGIDLVAVLLGLF